MGKFGRGNSFQRCFLIKSFILASFTDKRTCEETAPIIKERQMKVAENGGNSFTASPLTSLERRSKEIILLFLSNEEPLEILSIFFCVTGGINLEFHC